MGQVRTIERVAAQLQVRPTAVRKFIRKRHPRPLPFIKVGKFVRFKQSPIDEWLTQAEQDREKYPEKQRKAIGMGVIKRWP